MTLGIAVREQVSASQREHSSICATDRSSRNESHVGRAAAQVQRTRRQYRQSVSEWRLGQRE
jgi:hypothetical protein